MFENYVLILVLFVEDIICHVHTYKHKLFKWFVICIRLQANANSTAEQWRLNEHSVVTHLKQYKTPLVFIPFVKWKLNEQHCVDWNNHKMEVVNNTILIEIITKG